MIWLAPSAAVFAAENVSVGEAAVVSRGLDSRVWQTVRDVPFEGTTKRIVEEYKELTTGLHYVNGAGELAEAKEVIDIVNGFGVATQGQHRAIFSPSITDSPVTDWSAPDGQRFQTKLMGIVFFEASSGRSELIAETKPSVGQVQGNAVTYADAFDDVSCDVRYTYKRNSFEQDVLILRQLPDPALWEMDPQTVLVQIWTEMLECPVPEKRTTYLRRETDPAKRQAMAAPDFTDERLSFSQCRIGRGKAFSIENDAIGEPGSSAEKSVAVGKELATIQGKTFLLESAPYLALKPFLDKLPRTASLPSRTNQTGRLAGARLSPGAASAERRTPTPLSGAIQTSSVAAPEDRRAPLVRSRERLLAAFRKNTPHRPGDAKMQLAQASKPLRYSKAINWDYAILIGSTNTYTFRAAETAYLTGPFSPTSAIFEGGTVLKYAPTNNASIQDATLIFQGSTWRPVIATARDDDSVGTKITGSTGSPDGHVYANPAFLDSKGSTYQNLRISFANVGMTLDADSATTTIRHCQFVHCGDGVRAYGTDPIVAENCLFYDITGASFNAYEASSSLPVQVSHLTVDVCGSLTLAPGGSGTLALTNSLLVSVTNIGPFTMQTASVVTNSSSPSVFSIVGAGAHYLLPGSPYRDVGTTNLSSTLLADLKQRTTWPPMMFESNSQITVSTTLYPVAQPDTDIPDLGFHYPRADYGVDYLQISNATVTVPSGTVIATFGQEGIIVRDNASLICSGTPFAPVHFTRFSAIQELSTNWDATLNLAATYKIMAFHYTNQPNGTGYFRFTTFDAMSPGGYEIYSSSFWSFLSLTLQDCVSSAGLFEISSGSTTLGAALLQNNLFESSTCNFWGDFYLSLYNNLWAGGTAYFDKFGNTNHTWAVKDNAFDNCNVGWDDDPFTLGSNNAYINSTQLQPTNATDVVLASLAWQTGPLGRWYQPTNGALLNVGSRNATNAGLYFFTTLTNQMAETNSIVDISYHYPAINLSTGLATDYDSDLLADWLEDWNGNGAYDAANGETDWQSYTSKYGIGPGPGLVVFTPLK